jgi:hypothetical protein
LIAAQIGAIVISLTITGAIFQNIGYQNVSAVLAGQNFTSEDIHGALAGVRSRIFTDATPEIRQQVIDAIVSTIRTNFIIVIVAGAVSLVASLLMKREKVFMEVSAGA